MIFVSEKIPCWRICDEKCIAPVLEIRSLHVKILFNCGDLGNNDFINTLSTKTSEGEGKKKKEFLPKSPTRIRAVSFLPFKGTGLGTLLLRTQGLPPLVSVAEGKKIFPWEIQQCYVYVWAPSTALQE